MEMQVASPAWPVRLAKCIGNGVKNALGQLVTKEFWIKLAQIAAEEMVSAFLMTLGTRFTVLGRSRENAEIKKMAQTMAQGTGSAAFSSGSYPRSEPGYVRPGYDYHSPSYNRSYPVAVTKPATDSSFPGL